MFNAIKQLSRSWKLTSSTFHEPTPNFLPANTLDCPLATIAHFHVEFQVSFCLINKALTWMWLPLISKNMCMGPEMSKLFVHVQKEEWSSFSVMHFTFWAVEVELYCTCEVRNFGYLWCHIHICNKRQFLQLLGPFQKVVATRKQKELALPQIIATYFTWFTFWDAWSAFTSPKHCPLLFTFTYIFFWDTRIAFTSQKRHFLLYTFTPLKCASEFSGSVFQSYFGHSTEGRRKKTFYQKKAEKGRLFFCARIRTILQQICFYSKTCKCSHSGKSKKSINLNSLSDSIYNNSLTTQIKEKVATLISLSP